MTQLASACNPNDNKSRLPRAFGARPITNTICDNDATTNVLERSGSILDVNVAQAARWQADVLWRANSIVLSNEIAGITSGNIVSVVTLSETTSPFANLDVLRSDDRLVREAIDALRSSSIRFRDRLADRIEWLLTAYQEDYDGRVFSVDSLRSLVQFFGVTPTLKYPSLTVTPSGELYANWKRERECIFSIQFLATREVRFVIVRPNPNHPAHTEQFSGRTTTDVLMRAVAPYDVLDWASE